MKRCSKAFPLVGEREGGFALFADRGFTSHEHLPWFNLINMNGRLYDPLVGRFLSADNVIQDPTSTQNFNRYSYCLNNPLKYTDVSGMMMAENSPGTQTIWWAFQESSSGMGYWANGGGGGSSYGVSSGGVNGYYYSSGHYYDRKSRNMVSFDEVYNNYVVPNSVLSFSGSIAKDLIKEYQHESAASSFGVSDWDATLTAGPGGVVDAAYKVANTLNEINPIAQLWDIISFGFTGKDRFGNEMNMTEAYLKCLAVVPIPIGEIGNLVGPEAKNLTYEIIYRSKLGADGGISRHIIESLDGISISKTHQVFLEGEIIHQHQLRIGAYGTTRYFPEEWLNNLTIDK